MKPDEVLTRERAGRKRVLFVTHVGEPGGGEYKMIDLCRDMRESAEVMLHEHGPLETLLSSHRIKYSVRPLPATARRVRKEGGLMSILKAVPGVVSLIRGVAQTTRKFDAVVCFSQKSFVLAALAKPFGRRPIVWFMNDILAPAHFSRTLTRTVLLLSRVGAKHVVLNSQASLDAWIESGGRRTNVSVIYPGTFEAAVFAQVSDRSRIDFYREIYSPKGAPLIGMFGRIGRWKGQHVFLKAIAAMPEVKAIIVGGALFGEDDYENQVRALAKELGVEYRVAFVGHREDSMKLMAACDVVAHCSTAPEPFGLVIAEAMLVGIPVVASDAGGAREIVVDNETGLLTPPEDHEALANAIRRYLDDPAWSERVVRRARARARTKFSGAAMASSFHEVLDTL